MDRGERLKALDQFREDPAQLGQRSTQDEILLVIAYQLEELINIAADQRRFY